MENDLNVIENGRQPHIFLSLQIEDELNILVNGRQPKLFSNGRQPEFACQV